MCGDYFVQVALEQAYDGKAVHLVRLGLRYLPDGRRAVVPDPLYIRVVRLVADERRTFIDLVGRITSAGKPEIQRLVVWHPDEEHGVMELAELIRGIATDEVTFDAVREVVLKVGKVPANSEDFPAFIVNRILMPMVNEAIYTLYEGVGTVEGIDSSMRLGANHRMGPLELADFIGLDTCLDIMQVLYEGLADTKYRPCPLLVKYVEAGWLGRKAERGFYDYRGEKPVPTR